MSNEAEAMKNKRERTLTPKLRFPEFREEPAWEKKLVNEISDVNPNHGGLPDSFVYIDLESVEQGNLVTQKVINQESAPSRAQRLLRKQDLIYQTVRPYQRNNLFFDMDDGREYVASTGYAQLRAYASPSFLFQLLHTDNFVNKVLAKCTGSNYPAISSSDLAVIEVEVPPSTEQQKIAECLGSLDGLIAAQGRKLAALRDHKRGLMQHLFPQPGETEPRLRFPEFRDKEEWGETPLGGLLSRKPEYGVNAAAVPFSEDLPKYIRITDIDDQGQYAQENPVSVEIQATDDNYLVEGDIVLARTGASVGKSYRFRQSDGRLVFAGFLIRVRPNPKKLVPDFLSNYLSTWQYWDWVRVNSARSGQPGINGSEYASLPVPLPPDGTKGNELAEQQKIAACLSSLDNQITAQAAKIDTLKQHKRGLMQQLFPAPQEL